MDLSSQSGLSMFFLMESFYAQKFLAVMKSYYSFFSIIVIILAKNPCLSPGCNYIVLFFFLKTT